MFFILKKEGKKRAEVISCLDSRDDAENELQEILQELEIDQEEIDQAIAIGDYAKEGYNYYILCDYNELGFIE